MSSHQTLALIALLLTVEQTGARAQELEPKRLVGPFVKGTGHWNRAPLCDFESVPGPIASQYWYEGSSRLIFMASEGASGSAMITEKAAALGKYGLSIKPNRFRGSGISVAFDGLIAVVPGHTYVLSGFIKRLKPSAPEAYVYLDLWGTGPWFLSSADTTEWQFIYGTFAAAQPSYGVRAVVGHNMTSEGEIYYDEIALTPIEQFEPPEVAGVPKQAAARAAVENGRVVSIQVINPGAAYTNIPTVMLEGGGGAGASGFALMTNGFIDHIALASNGSGYTSNPAVFISRPVSDPALAMESSPLRQVLYLTAGREYRVVLYLVAARRYVLQESADLESWSSLGSPFLAEGGVKMEKLSAVTRNRYVRVSETGKP